MEQYLYVFDYCVGAIYEIKTNNSDIEFVEDILTQYGLKESNCNWMVSDHKLEIETIDKI